MPNADLTRKLETVNTVLSAALPTLGMVMELGRMVADLIKPGNEVLDQQKFDDDVAKIHAFANKLQSTSADWFAEHPEYDPATGRRRA